MKRIVVLKSMRTKAGAEDWSRLMSHVYPNSKVVDTETLKSFGPFDVGSPTMSHVIMEEDLSPVVTVLKKGEAGEIVKALTNKGFMSIDKFGPTLTPKWHEMIDGYVASILSDAFKSVSELEYTFNGSVNGGSLDALKALEDATVLASMGDATENDDFGHALRDNVAISDGEASGAFEGKAAAADVRDPEMDGEGISDSEIESSTRQGSHVVKSIRNFDEHLYTVFKSLGEAREWKNPDIGVYQVVPASRNDKSVFGEDSKYIVRSRFEWYEDSILKSAKADKRTQGLTSPESVSDDGGTKAVEARASQVDSKKKDTLKGLVDEVVDFALKGVPSNFDAKVIKSAVLNMVFENIENLSSDEVLGDFVAKCVRKTIKENMSPKETPLDNDVQGTSKPKKAIKSSDYDEDEKKEVAKGDAEDAAYFSGLNADKKAREKRQEDRDGDTFDPKRDEFL